MDRPASTLFQKPADSTDDRRRGNYPGNFLDAQRNHAPFYGTLVQAGHSA
jgi:hypothetical protein